MHLDHRVGADQKNSIKIHKKNKNYMSHDKSYKNVCCKSSRKYIKLSDILDHYDVKHWTPAAAMWRLSARFGGNPAAVDVNCLDVRAIPEKCGRLLNSYHPDTSSR